MRADNDLCCYAHVFLSEWLHAEREHLFEDEQPGGDGELQLSFGVHAYRHELSEDDDLCGYGFIQLSEWVYAER